MLFSFVKGMGPGHDRRGRYVLCERRERYHCALGPDMARPGLMTELGRVSPVPKPLIDGRFG